MSRKKVYLKLTNPQGSFFDPEQPEVGMISNTQVKEFQKTERVVKAINFRRVVEVEAPAKTEADNKVKEDLESLKKARVAAEEAQAEAEKKAEEATTAKEAAEKRAELAEERATKSEAQLKEVLANKPTVIPPAADTKDGEDTPAADTDNTPAEGDEKKVPATPAKPAKVAPPKKAPNKG